MGLRFGIVLGGCLMISGWGNGFERELFAFQNGLPFGSAFERVAVLKEFGFHGIGSAKPNDLDERLKLYRENGLRIYSLYLGAALGETGETPVPGTIADAIPRIAGSSTVIELYLRGNKSKHADAEVVRFVRAVADQAQKHRVKIVLYPHAGFYIETLSDAVRIAKLAKRKNVGVMFNLCHFLKVEPDKDLRAELEQAKPWLWRVSLSGADLGGRNWAELIRPLDEGSFDQETVLSLLDEIEYTGPVGLQCYGIKGNPKENLAKSIKAWRELNGQRPPSKQAAEVVANYQKRFSRYNEKPYPVNGMIFLLCRGLEREELEKMKHRETGPHTLTAINIYLNEAALASVKQKNKRFPPGSIIVKEKAKKLSYSFSGPDGFSGREGIGGMIKREPGYDPDNGDWEYFYADEKGDLSSGKMRSCINCHRKAESRDYIFQSWVGRKTPAILQSLTDPEALLKTEE